MAIVLSFITQAKSILSFINQLLKGLRQKFDSYLLIYRKVQGTGKSGNKVIN